MRGTVSVIIPTFKRPDFLEKCLVAFSSQLSPQDELIVVIDGDAERYARLLQRFEHDAKFIIRENGGKAAAANDGLKAAEGEYIWLFDDDDLPLPGALERLATFMDNHPEFGFCVTQFEYARYEGGDIHTALVPNGRVSKFPDKAGRGLLLPLLEANYIGGAALFLRRRTQESVGPYNTSLIRSQDYEMAIRCALEEDFDLVPGGPTFLYAQHSLKRGSRKDRFTARLQRLKWLEYDRRIYRELIDRLPMSAFLEHKLERGLAVRSADIRDSTQPQVSPLALVNKARVAGSKLLSWTSYRYLRRRCTEFPDTELSQKEIVRLGTMFALGDWYQLRALGARFAFLLPVLGLLRYGKVGRQMSAIVLLASLRGEHKDTFEDNTLTH
ncbi:MAG: glycosyltransferase family 2 protein [Pseudomonadota bacterium]